LLGGQAMIIGEKGLQGTKYEKRFEKDISTNGRAIS